MLLSIKHFVFFLQCLLLLYILEILHKFKVTALKHTVQAGREGDGKKVKTNKIIKNWHDTTSVFRAFTETGCLESSNKPIALFMIMIHYTDVLAVLLTSPLLWQIKPDSDPEFRFVLFCFINFCHFFWFGIQYIVIPCVTFLNMDKTKLLHIKMSPWALGNYYFLTFYRLSHWWTNKKNNRHIKNKANNS